MAFKELICPHCKKSISVFDGFEYDENLNMLCGGCGEVIFATTKAVEEKNRAILQGNSSGYYPKKDLLLPIKISPTNPIALPSD